MIYLVKSNDLLMTKKKSIQSKGGAARAEKLTAEQRAEIASRAGKAGWATPKAIHEGEISLGSNGSIPCAVLEDGTRVLTQSGFMRALGRARQAKGRDYYDGDVNMPAFLTANNLKPFIGNDLGKTSSQIEFRQMKRGGPKAFGYPAELLPKVCEVFLKAREEGVLHASQMHIAKQAEILVRGLAQVGIVALVDEATGFQEVRAKTALAEILEKFIAVELQAWTRAFPLEFYEQIFRLKKWPFDPLSVKRPSVIGHYTNNFIYKRLAPGVLDELRKKEPKIDGRRKNKLYKWLSGEVGHPKLLAHIEGVLALMKTSDTWDEFMDKLDVVYPVIEVTELGLEVKKTPKPKK